MDKARVLVMSLHDSSREPRPRRAIEACHASGYEVDAMSAAMSAPLPVSRHIAIASPSSSLVKRLLNKTLRLLRLYRLLDGRVYGFRKIAADLAERAYSLIIVEELTLLPLALRVRGGAKVLFDAREFYPAQRENSLLFRIVDLPYVTRLCTRYLPDCDAVVTVSPGLVDAYLDRFGVRCDLIRSVPRYKEVAPRPPEPGRIRMVHHGVANRNRKIENMIDVMAHLDERFELDFYLVDNPRYVAELKGRAAGNPRIRFCAPVPFADLVETLAQYDVGLALLEATTFNLAHCLPNKLFEYIQARLVVAIGPSADMATVVREYSCGIVAETFEPEDLAGHLGRLDGDRIAAIKANSDKAARELCWEKESLRYLGIIGDLLSTARAGG